MPTPPPRIQLKWHGPNIEQEIEEIDTFPLIFGREQMENMVSLNSRFVSDQHALLDWQDEHIVIVDLESKNGTYVNGRSISSSNVTILDNNSVVQIGPFAFSPTIISNKIVSDEDETIAPPPSLRQIAPPDLTFSPFSDALTFGSPEKAVIEDPLPKLLQNKKVPMAALQKLVDLETTTYLTVGGGLGSFTWVDYLRIGGVAPENIIAIGFEEKPYGRYQKLCQNSQIPGHERLRSNSDSCPDNVWGWPGYAVREMWDDVQKGKVSHAVKIGWQLFNEPFTPTYTPVAEHVYDAIDREAERIHWEKMWRQGRVRAIRQTDDGRYLIAYSDMHAKNKVKIILCTYLHLAVGYPGVRFLPDLQAYRQNTGDFQHVVNAYEDHDHIYDALQEKGGIVLVRGRGIVASRIIQRLVEIRQEHHVPIGILHLMRKPLPTGKQYKNAQRHVNNHWEFQPFNWPKAAWGGDLRHTLAQENTQDRANLIDLWGGTTTADRPDWQEMVSVGLREGWYEIQFGEVQDVQADPSGRVATYIQNNGVVQRGTQLLTDYIIDATGLESEIDKSPLLHDLLTLYKLPRNAQHRLQVNDNFELETMRNGNGRMYASGIITLGGSYAPVDSFLGLQYAALRSVDHLIAQRAPQLRRLNGVRSVYQWMRWAKGEQP